MSKSKTAPDGNAPSVSPGSSGEGGTSAERPPAVPETFVARGSGDFEIVLPRVIIEEALGKLMETTGAPEFHDAMELVWFKSDPERNPGVRELVSMLLTLYRCSLDGNVKPPVNLEELYAEKYRGTVLEGRRAPGNMAPGP